MAQPVESSRVGCPLIGRPFAPGIDRPRSVRRASAHPQAHRGGSRTAAFGATILTNPLFVLVVVVESHPVPIALVGVRRRLGGAVVAHASRAPLPLSAGVRVAFYRAPDHGRPTPPSNDLPDSLLDGLHEKWLPAVSLRSLHEFRPSLRGLRAVSSARVASRIRSGDAGTLAVTTSEVSAQTKAMKAVIPTIAATGKKAKNFSRMSHPPLAGLSPAMNAATRPKKAIGLATPASHCHVLGPALDVSWADCECRPYHGDMP